MPTTLHTYLIVFGCSCANLNMSWTGFQKGLTVCVNWITHITNDSFIQAAPLLPFRFWAVVQHYIRQWTRNVIFPVDMLYISWRQFSENRYWAKKWCNIYESIRLQLRPTLGEKGSLRRQWSVGCLLINDRSKVHTHPNQDHHSVV